MSPLLIVVGVLVVSATGADVLWTVVAAGSGAGPITGRLSALAWRTALAFGRREEGSRHGLLAVSGVAIVVGMLLSWAFVSCIGWWIVSSSADGAVRMAETGAPADWFGRAAFVGANLFTLGSSTYTAGDGLWQLVPIGIAANGLVFLTLGISYLVPVASSVAERRQLAQYILSLGRTPELLLTHSWTGNDFGALSQHLVVLAPMLHLAGERHLTYPALAYFHSAREHASSTISVVVLDEALTLLREGVTSDVRPDAATIDALHRALGGFLHTVGGQFVSSEVEPLPPPDLEVLRDAGIPTEGDEEFASAIEQDLDRRRELAALLAHDGWTVAAWERRRRDELS